MGGFLSRLGRGLTTAAPYAGQVAEAFDPAVQRRREIAEALARMNVKKVEQELAAGERETVEADRMKGLAALAKSDIGRVLSANPAGFDKTAPVTEITPEEFSSRFQGERAKVEPLASSRLMSEAAASGSLESPVAWAALEAMRPRIQPPRSRNIRHLAGTR